MSNDISRVYQFLAKQGANNAWVDKADANGDGAVTKTEFRNFLNENFEWDGETTDAGKNDLINSFWKTVDTNTSGKVNGTKIKNKNALDKKEVENMEAKIKLYEELNNYTSSIIAPSFINNGSNWLKSVSEGLSNLVEKNYTGKPEDLENWLDSENRAASVMAKATADYCANEYIADVMADAVKQYGYAYGSDNTLQGLINNYIQNHLDGFEPDEIQEAVRGIIDSYMSTAQLNRSRGGIEDLKDYGYAPNEKSPLNELQKSVIKSKIEKSISSEKNYEKYKDMYDSAMISFLDGIKYGDFSRVNDDVLRTFKESDAYKNIDKAIQAKEIFLGNDLKAALNKAIGESIGNRINGVLVGEIPSYDKIVEDAMTKAKNGDFDTNGTLDKQKLINWIVDQIKANLADFYPNGFDDMPLGELNNMYDALVKSAKENQDAEKVKEAAISYCRAISTKSDTLAQAVIDVFGDNYASVINQLLTGEIETKMAELKTKVASIGDVTKMKYYEKSALFNNIGSSYTLSLGEVKTLNVATTTTCNGEVVTSDRIKYEASGCISVDDSGKVTINTENAGTFTGTITVLIDGTKVSSKTIEVIVENKLSTDTIIENSTWNENALSSLSKGNSDYSKGDGGLRIWGGNRDYNDKSLNGSGASFADLYNGGYNIELMTTSNDSGDASSKNIERARGRLLELGNLVVSTIASSNPSMDREKLQQAMNNVNDRWIKALDNKGNKKYTHTDSKNDKHGCNKASQREASNSTYNRLSDLTKTDTKEITFGQATKGNNQGIYMVNFKAYVDAIIAEYNTLVK